MSDPKLTVARQTQAAKKIDGAAARGRAQADAAAGGPIDVQKNLEAEGAKIKAAGAKQAEATIDSVVKSSGVLDSVTSQDVEKNLMAEGKKLGDAKKFNEQFQKLDPKNKVMKEKEKDGKGGDEIKSVQKALSQIKDANGKPYFASKHGETGAYHKDTKAAVEKFQKDNGLTVDGKVGPHTLKAMKYKMDEQMKKDGVIANTPLTPNERVEQAHSAAAGAPAADPKLKAALEKRAAEMRAQP